MLINNIIFWSVRRKETLLLVVILLFVLPHTFSQNNNSSLVPLKVKKGSYVFLYDSLYHFNHDTILYLSNTLLPDDPESIQRTKVFYDSLQAKASRRSLTKRIYDLAIVLPPEANYLDHSEKVSNDYSDSEGKVIRKITIKRLDPFGTNINEPESDNATGFSEFLNRTHPVTKEFVLRNYLMFREGDKFSPFELSESERIIRKLKFIDDAKIIVIPVSEEMVDIHIVTRDIYSLGLNYEFGGAKSGMLEIFERSLFGLGHDFVISFPYNYYVDYYGLGYQFSYKMRNISKSLIDASATYSNALGKEYYELSLDRKFISATTTYAGGFNIRETFTSSDLDTLETRAPLDYNNLDIWFGRSFMIDKSNMTRLILSGRYINNNVYERPEITSNSYYSLQKYRVLLGSISLVKQNYYKTSLIYNYGRTEDIAYGGKFYLSFGREINEFNKRNYYGLGLSMANFPGKIGYFYLNTQVGFFHNGESIEQGALDMEANYISNLTTMGKYRFRYFASLRYTRGYNRFDDEYLRINNNAGIRGFSNDTIRPEQRLILNLETISFTPIYIYGFRFAFYGFTDLGIFSNNNTYTLNNNLVSEIGLGLRIRNDKLIFNTIQFRFSYFPFSPPYSTTKNFEISGEKLLESKTFDPTSPKIIYYR